MSKNTATLLILWIGVAFYFTGCKNNTAEQSESEIRDQAIITCAKTVLKSFCNEDYELFMRVSEREDTPENRDTFDAMCKNYKGVDYEKLPLEIIKDDNGNRIIDDFEWVSTKAYENGKEIENISMIMFFHYKENSEEYIYIGMKHN